ncbi:MAG: hypothetical protein KF893_04905 [Caldilineaceae bacterium]|nr:hypothetical protein [Caldilineaceae bacterium]
MQQRDEAAGDVVGALIDRAPGEPGEAAILAGEAVLDAWPGGVTPACCDTVIQSLLLTLRDDGRVTPPRKSRRRAGAVGRSALPRRRLVSP